MIYQIFLNQLQLTPERTALVTSSGEQFTYAQVQRRVNQWANYLTAQGIGAGDRVAALLDNEDNHFFILLALDRINSTYVPFDTDIPKQQLVTDIKTLNLKKLMIDAKLIPDFEVEPALQLPLDRKELDIIKTYNDSEPLCSYDTACFDKILYIMSSSGSTGHKKWIPIAGAGIVYWASLIEKLFGKGTLNPLFRMLSTRSPAYDARIFEYVVALSLGAELHLLNRFQRKDTSSILAVAKDANIYGLLLIASQLKGEEAARIINDLAANSCVKQLMVTGDACTPYLKELCEKNAINLWNCYGPTEATFGASILKVNNLKTAVIEGQSIVPIAKPDGPDAHFHLIDGKLYLESPYLTPGYLDENDTKNHFSEITNDQGEKIRLFDTGDAFVEEDGHYFYQGRASQSSHCKISGVKVTAENIQRHIQNYKQDGLSVAVVIKEHLGQDKPVAYLVIPPNFNDEHFLAYLEQHLQKEATPVLICLKELPQLPTSQKIDTQQLIKRQDSPEELFINRHKDSISPKEETDSLKMIKQIWCELFQQTDIPTDAEFVLLGGDSLMALQMVHKIEQRLQNGYSYQNLLGLTKITIESIAESLSHNSAIQQLTQHAIIQPLSEIDPTKETIFFLPALLGEGYFSYRYLAARMAKQYDCNVYGLSEPGINNSELLPESLEHAANRYIRAIKSIQTHGRVKLVGFSFGSTLAYEVAKQLSADSPSNIDVHLIDGLPPYLYQSLSDKNHIKLLQSLMNFMVANLTNRFYGETLDPIDLTQFEALNKLQQLDASFELLETKLKNPASKNLLAVAKLHLKFVLTAKEPERLFRGVYPTLYLTSQTQQYLQIIDDIPELSKDSSEYLYYFWTHYFENITRCGISLECDHLGVIRSGPPVDKQTADCYWERENDSEQNMMFGKNNSSLNPFYYLRPLSDGSKQFSAFFINRRMADGLYNSLKDKGFSPTLVPHDQNLQQTYDGKDCIYTSTASLFCQIPEEEIAHLTWARRCGKRKECPINALNPSHNKTSTEVAQSGNIDLIIQWKNTNLMTLSFKYNATPDVLTADLNQKLGLTPVKISADKTNITFQYCVNEPIGGIDNALFKAEDLLADFITTMTGYIPNPKVPAKEARNFRSFKPGITVFITDPDIKELTPIQYAPENFSSLEECITFTQRLIQGDTQISASLIDYIFPNNYPKAELIKNEKLMTCLRDLKECCTASPSIHLVDTLRNMLIRLGSDNAFFMETLQLLGKLSQNPTIPYILRDRSLENLGSLLSTFIDKDIAKTPEYIALMQQFMLLSERVPERKIFEYFRENAINEPWFIERVNQWSQREECRDLCHQLTSLKPISTPGFLSLIEHTVLPNLMALHQKYRDNKLGKGVSNADAKEFPNLIEMLLAHLPVEVFSKPWFKEAISNLYDASDGEIHQIGFILLKAPPELRVLPPYSDMIKDLIQRSITSTDPKATFELIRKISRILLRSDILESLGLDKGSILREIKRQIQAGMALKPEPLNYDEFIENMVHSFQQDWITLADEIKTERRLTQTKGTFFDQKTGPIEVTNDEIQKHSSGKKSAD